MMIFRKWGRHTATVFAFLLLAAAISTQYQFPEVMGNIRLKIFDTFQQIQPRTYRNVPVRIIDLDNETLLREGQWPWPRTKVAQLIERLNEAGAAAIVLDIVFAEPDRTSPKNILSLWADSSPVESLRPQLLQLKDHDDALAEAISQANVVTAFSLTEESNSIKPVRKSTPAFSGDNPIGMLPAYHGTVANIPKIAEAAKGNGSFTVLAEADGIIRRVPLVFRLEDQIYPSLVLEALRTAQGASTYILKSSTGSGEKNFDAQPKIVNIKVGSLIVPTDGQGRMRLYDSGYQSQRFIPAWKVLSGNFDSESIEGAIVFIGTSATGLKDIRATPLNPVAAGVEIQAQLTEQILLQDFLYRPDWALGSEFLYLIVFGTALTLLLPHLGAAWCAMIGIASIFTAFGLSWYGFSKLNLLIDPVVPSLVAVLLYFSVSLMNFLRTESEKKQVRDAFGMYLSPALVKRLAEDSDQLKLGGEMKNLTVLFTDIRGFTARAEQMSAEELTRFMNGFLTPMTDIILEKQGTIDKYIGDCIMAFWNAPLDDLDHAKHACEAALQMRDRLVELNVRSVQPIRMGIGLNTGNCSVGNMGSRQRFNYSVIGDDVNLASRLESQSKTYGMDIVLGQNTYEQVKGRGFAVLELDLIQVVGKTQPVRVYTLLGGPELHQSSAFQARETRHQEFLTAYRSQNWKLSRELIEACMRLDGDQKQFADYYELHKQRIESFVLNPPGENWDGVFIATSK